jgi:integrase
MKHQLTGFLHAGGNSAENQAKAPVLLENAPVRANGNAVLKPIRPEPTRLGAMNKPASAATTAEHFKYRGRQWRIFKRQSPQGASPNWYFYFEHNRQRCGPWSLGTDSKQHALAEAKLKIDLYFDQRAAQLRGTLKRTGADFTPLHVIIGRHGSDDLGLLPDLPTKKNASASTRRGYGYALRWVLAAALGVTMEQTDELTTAVFTKETARKFFDAIARRAMALPTQKEQLALLNSAYSFYGHARALLAPRPLEALKTSHQCQFPDVTDFRNGLALFGQHRPAAEAVELPSDEVIRKTIREWIRLAATPDYRMPGGDRSTEAGKTGAEFALAPMAELDRRNLFIAIGLELSCGLRASEVQRVQRHWITSEAGLPLLRCSDTTAKNRSGKIEVSPLNPFWKILWFWIGKNNWDVAPEEFLLATGRLGNGKVSIADRTYYPQIFGGRWLRWLGWHTAKSNHALRDFSASMITMRYGIGEACDWCRHSSIATTEKHYSRFVKLSKRVEPKKLAWLKWAK